MHQVPKETSPSARLRREPPQAASQHPEERRCKRPVPEAPEGAHPPPAGPQTLQETGAAPLAGTGAKCTQGQGRAGSRPGGGNEEGISGLQEEVFSIYPVNTQMSTKQTRFALPLCFVETFNSSAQVPHDSAHHFTPTGCCWSFSGY